MPFSPPTYEQLIHDAAGMVNSLFELKPMFSEACSIFIHALQTGHRILTAGNGGSAAEAMHMAEELSGRYHFNRQALPGIALCADGTALTCIANDFGFDAVFSRQVEAFGTAGDVLVLFTTSGNSENLVCAAKAAHARGMKVVGMVGKGGGCLREHLDFMLDVKASSNAHVQEGHQILMHAFFEQIDAVFVPDEEAVKVR